MLKTNSKQVKDNIRNYIVNNFTPENYTDAPPVEWPQIAAFILETFKAGKYSCAADYRYYKNNEAAAFADWCTGLPSVLDTCYFYNRSAVDDLGDILEETETEKAHFSESEAEQLLTALIYREIKRGTK